MSLSTQHMTNGYKLNPYNVTVASATAPVLLCGADGARMSVEFYVDSSQSGSQLYIGYDSVMAANPAATSGVLNASSTPKVGRPLPVGASYTDSISQDGWWAVSTAGTSTVVSVTIVRKGTSQNQG